MIPALAILASIVSCTMPRYSAWPDCRPAVGVPAGIKHRSAYVLNITRGTHKFELLYRLTAPVAGRWDGQRWRFIVPERLCAPGDSCEVSVGVADSARNWTCGGDAIYRWRAR